VKLFERWARIGVRRSSSSRRGRARDVIYLPRMIRTSFGKVERGTGK
jgi:hypothetical protein